MTGNSTQTVDQSGLKVAQALTILLLVGAYILNAPWLVAVVAIAQLLGALNLPIAPYRLMYQYVLKPTGVVKPRIIQDHPDPHGFALLVGSLFTGTATLALGLNVPVVGWLLVGVVVVLANLNFWLNFCAGCWMYYQFNRLGVPGFTHAPLPKQG
jgi:hypothetical protein